MTICAIKMCRNYKGRVKTTKHITYHRIPMNPIIRNRWIDFIKKSRGDATWKPTKTTVVCSDHFRSKDMYTVNKTGRRRLKKEAVPSKALFLLSVKSSESEDSDDIEIVEGNDSPGPDRTSQIPEGKVLIARVYHYLEKEYKQLKDFTGNSTDLRPLANILKRTAEATGVTEDTVTTILEEEQLSKEPVQEPFPEKRQKLHHEIKNVSASPMEEHESSSDSADEDQQTDDAGQEEYHVEITEEFKVEVQDHETSTDLVLSPTTYAEVKIEPDEDEADEDKSQQCSSPVYRVIYDTSLPTVKSEPDDDVTHDMEVCTNNVTSDPLQTPDISEPPEHGSTTNL